MAIYIEMPKLSDTMTEGTLLKWRKNEGDKVEAGDVLAEVETDKATMEMEAFDDGVLHKQLVAAGSKVAIGSKVALLLQKGEAPPAEGAEPAPSARAEAAKADTTAPPPEAAPKKEAAAAPAAPEKDAPRPSPNTGRVKASPLAKKIAASKGVELSRSKRHRPWRAHRRQGCRGWSRRRSRKDRGTCARRRHASGRRGSAHPAERHAPRDR